MPSNSLSEIREKFIFAALAKLQGADLSGDPATADLLLNGALLKTLDTVGNDSPGLMTDLESYGTTSNYIGVAYNRTTDTFVRLGASSNEPCGQLMNVQISPIFNRIRRVALQDDGSVYKGISWVDFTKYDDGSDVDLTGADGQVMVEYLPAYYKAGIWGEWYYMMISHIPLPGFSIFPLFDGFSAVYRGAYEASVYDGKMCSIARSPVDGVSDVFPVTSREGDWGHIGLTAQEGDALATARGDGWQQESLLTALWERVLMIIGYASFDVPGIVGEGRVSLSSGDWINGSYIGKCGLGDTASGYASAVQNGGTAGYASDYSQVLGVENPWGNVWKRVVSLISDGAVFYKGTSPSSAEYGSTSSWTRLLDASGAGITLPDMSGYAGTPHSGLGIVLPSDVSGTSSTKMHDYYYYSGGLRVLLVGGSANNGASAGPFFWHANDAASRTNAIIGGRLCFKAA